MEKAKLREKNALPSERLLLPSTETQLEGDIIKIEIPDSRLVIEIPIRASDHDTSKMYNAAIVYEKITRHDSHDLVFSDENLELTRSPSNDLMNFAHRLLNLIGISDNYELMTAEDIQRFHKCIDNLRKKDGMGNPVGDFEFEEVEDFSQQDFFELFQSKTESFHKLSL